MPHEGSVVLLALVLSMHAATGHAVTAPLHLAPGTRNVQLPPEVMVDRHLVWMERLLADDEPGAALEARTGGAADTGCDDPFTDDDDDHSWQNPGFLGSPQTDRHPVTCVSWDDAQTYLSWLSQTTGAAYRLPSAEELAAAAEGFSAWLP